MQCTSDDHRLSVLLADSNFFSRSGLRAVLESDEARRFVITDETEDADVTSALQVQPDVVVIDPAGVVGDAWGAIERLSNMLPASRIVVFTHAAAPEAAFYAVRAGARGYVLKTDTDAAFLRHAVWSVGQYGCIQIDPRVADNYRSRERETIDLVPPPDSPVPSISPQERLVLRGIVNGQNDKQIAHDLVIERTTVETYVRRLMTKLGAINRPHLAAIAVDKRLAQVARQLSCLIAVVVSGLAAYASSAFMSGCA